MKDINAPILPGLKLIVRKSNPIARAIWDAKSVYERRLVAEIVVNIRPTDDDFRTYDFDVYNMLGQGCGKKDLATAEAALAGLDIRTIEIYENDDDYPTKYPLFHMLKYNPHTKIISCRLAPELKPHLLKLRSHYTKYDLIESLRIKGCYCQALYDLLKSWCKTTPVYNAKLTYLHNHMCATPTMRSDFGHFRSRVIEYSQEQFVGTNIEFDYEVEKHRKKVVQVAFKFVNFGLPDEIEVEAKEVPEQINFAEYAEICCANNPERSKGNCPDHYKEGMRKAQKHHAFSICNVCDRKFGCGKYPAGDAQVHRKAEQQEVHQKLHEWRVSKALEQMTIARKEELEQKLPE